MDPLLAAVSLVAGDLMGSVPTTGEGTLLDLLVDRHPFVFQIEWLQNLIERIDQLLESVLDLVTTIRQLFGGEGG